MTGGICWAFPATDGGAVMAGRLLARGMLLGIVSACLMILFAELFGEPQVAHAIAFEQAMDRAAGMAAEPELVSRAVQRGVGLLTAGLMYGAAVGGLFALVFASLFQRIGRLSPRSLSAWLALAGFMVVALVPMLKYPANPPSIGAPGTIGLRTALYFELMLVSVGAIVLGMLAGRRLLARLGLWNAALAGVATVLLVVIVALLVMPDVSEVPAGFPAVVLWRFRIAALGMQAVLWGSLGLAFGAAAERLLQPHGARRPA